MEIAQEGAIPPLVALLRGGGTDTIKQAAAARALQNLALNTNNAAAIAWTGGIPPLIALLSGSGTDTTKEAAARALGNG